MNKPKFKLGDCVYYALMDCRPENIYSIISKEPIKITGYKVFDGAVEYRLQGRFDSLPEDKLRDNLDEMEDYIQKRSDEWFNEVK